MSQRLLAGDDDRGDDEPAPRLVWPEMGNARRFSVPDA